MCLRYNQNLIFFCAFHIIRIYKKFLFRGCCTLFKTVVAPAVLCICVEFFIKSVFAVGSEEVAVGDTLIFKNIAFFRNCLLCLSFAVFD